MASKHNCYVNSLWCVLHYASFLLKISLLFLIVFSVVHSCGCYKSVVLRTALNISLNILNRRQHDTYTENSSVREDVRHNNVLPEKCNNWS